MARGDWRLFVAIAVPDALAAAIDAHLVPLRRRHPDARWIPAAFRHLTLVFLGWVDPTHLGGLIAGVDEIARRREPFHVEIGAGGGHARRGEDGVAWLSLGAGGPQVAALAADLSAVLPPPPLGGRPAGERPHVTVARRASSVLIHDLESLPAADPPLAWTAEGITLFRSHLGPPGARYEPIHVARLGRGRGAAPRA